MTFLSAVLFDLSYSICFGTLSSRTKPIGASFPFASTVNKNIVLSFDAVANLDPSEFQSIDTMASVCGLTLSKTINDASLRKSTRTTPSLKPTKTNREDVSTTFGKTFKTVPRAWNLDVKRSLH